MTTRSPFSRWIFEEYDIDESSLGISRILFSVSLLAFVYPSYLWMLKFPATFYTPPLSIGIFFRQQPPAPVLWLFLAMMITLTLGLLVGWKVKLMGIGLAVVMLVGNSFEFSLGKINHDILLIATLLTMSFSGWGRKYSVEADSDLSNSPRWPFALLAMLIGMAMLSAALPKITSGWLDLSTQSAKGHMIYNVYATERPMLIGQIMLAHGSKWFWEFIDWSTIGIEMSFILAMFSRRAMRVVCALAVLFHAGIHFSMDIFFFSNIIAYAMFVEWERGHNLGFVNGLLNRFDQVARRVRGWMILVVGLALAVLYAVVGNPVELIFNIFGNGIWIRDSVIAVAASFLVLIYFGGLLLGRWLPVNRVPTSPGPEVLQYEKYPVVLFDGVCGLCNGFVDFSLRRDRRGILRYAPLQSEVGQSILLSFGISGDDLSSIVLIREGRSFRYSTATLEILRLMGLPWSILYLLVFIPPPIRDIVYGTIANHRYRWFGRLEVCRLPMPQERERFLV